MGPRVLQAVAVAVLVGVVIAGPRPDEDEDVVSLVADNSLDPSEQDPDLDKYFAKVTEVLLAATGDPSLETGRRVALLNNSSEGVNPEELGDYLEGDIFVPKGLGRNGLVTEAARWTHGDVPYVLDNTFSPQDLGMIENAFNQYHAKTCVHFVPRSNQHDYIYITKANTGCWSSVGKIGGMQEVNLQVPGCTLKIGTIMHELMHAVGFMHEQNRSERDNFVTIVWNNIESGRRNNFDMAREGATTGFGVTYDYGSLMHYGEDAFSANGRPTIVAKYKGVTMGQREGFSSSDIKKIRAMYKCGSPRKG